MIQTLLIYGAFIVRSIFNSSAPRDEQTSSFLAVFLKSGVNVANHLKKYCSCGQHKQNFFKYFSTQRSDFKMSRTNDVCLLLGADESWTRDTIVMGSIPVTATFVYDPKQVTLL